MAEKAKTDENDAKSDTEKESEKKKSASKKSAAATDSANESEDKKETESTEEKTEAGEGDEAHVDKSTDNEDDEKKGDDKEKRKKFVRLWCVHCRIESATFKVRRNENIKCLSLQFNCISTLYVYTFRRITTIISIVAAINWSSADMGWNKRLAWLECAWRKGMLNVN